MSGERLLVVEDEESILTGLVLNLEMEGYQVSTAKTGREAVETFNRYDFDLVLLDVMLPELNGFEVLDQLRKKRTDVPVIFLSARDAQQDKVTGLDLGADDYITKPFGVPELLARVNAALRRTQKRENGHRISFGAVEIDTQSRRVTKSGGDLELTAREYDLLVYLHRSKNRVLTREQILRNVWGDDYEGTDRTVDNFVARLRTKIEDDPEAPVYIETVRGVGYRFRMPVTSP